MDNEGEKSEAEKAKINSLKVYTRRDLFCSVTNVTSCCLYSYHFLCDYANIILLDKDAYLINSAFILHLI